ncbi:unnamed protein product [Rhizoctonia solani]|uniref:Xylanolytic transcriptional activator regulatory domain-containing protein n=1 Tax=Rhizoctonia solani TaxID=456999 RepID=A0A8H2WM81_9AGAM|nr:unnamed protein product [Rhizoctonia solani]
MDTQSHKHTKQASAKTLVSCDQCLRSGSRCRFNPAKEEKCRGCHARHSECTWTQVPKPLPPPDSSYIEYLEARVKEVEKHLKTLFPGINTKKELDTLLDPQFLPIDNTNSTTLNQGRRGSDSSKTSLPNQTPLPSSTIVASTPATVRLIQQVRLANISPDHHHLPVDNTEEDAVWSATLSSREQVQHYHGVSSLEILSRDAGVLRNGYSPDSAPSTIPAIHRRPVFWQPIPAQIRYIKKYDWDSKNGLSLDLPPDDLIPVLVDTFFKAAFFPVIHRGMFEKQLKDGLHKRDGTFLRILLLVCATGARWCGDPRVLDERWPVPLSAGHRWFRQLVPGEKSPMEDIKLEDAQLQVLLVIYCLGTSGNYAGWVQSGIAVRTMLDVGAHRRRSTQSLENELFKRCFWTMMMLDRFQCISMGRHAAVQDLDIDLDYALEVDDELWSLEPGAPPPVQPTGIPSKLSCFNQMIKLLRIAGRCLQTVYALESTKRQIGLDGPQGTAWMFNDINSQFNQWVRDVPSFLRLPTTDNYETTRLFTDKIEMWTSYYDLVISANRTFIAKPSPLAVPALKICCDAARECTQILRAYLRNPESILAPPLMHPAFGCAMVLVIDLIAQAKSNSPTYDSYTLDQKEEDLKECMNVLKKAEGKFHLAGRYHDMVREFEEHWRVELSPRARSNDRSYPASGGSHSRQPSQKLPFDPSDSSFQNTKVKVKEEETSFDLTLPPEIIPPIQTSPHISDPPESANPAPSYDYAHPEAYADQMFEGLRSLPSLYSLPEQVSSSSQTQMEPSRQSMSTNPNVVNFEPYLPDYRYNARDAMQQHARRVASILHPPPDKTTEGYLNLSSAAIPGLGVFSPSGWMNSSSGAGWTSEPRQSIDSSEGIESPMGYWDATMRGTLGLHGRAYNPQSRTK